MPMEDSEILTLSKQLIACPSVTPHDAGCQQIIADSLLKLGFHLQPLRFMEVDNLWAIRGNTAPLFVFAGHTDVVPVGNQKDWLYPPFAGTTQEDFLYGRGSVDMKGSLAAMIIACQHFIKQYPHHKGSLAFLITSDEEGVAENGTRKVIEYLLKENIKIDYCIVGEPSSLNQVGDTLKIGRRGSMTGFLKIFGKQGHVAYPENAKNPIHLAMPALMELSQKTWCQGNANFPPTTFQIFNVNAGTGASNVIPGILECLFNFRFSTENQPETLQKAVTKILDHYSLSYEINWTLSGHPFLTVPGKLLQATIQSISEIQSITPLLSTNGGTSDGRFIAPTGAEVIELGPCNASIHSINECVRISDLEKLSDIYQRILYKLLM